MKVHRTRKEEEKRTESHYRYIPVTSSASRREDRSTIDFTRSAKTQYVQQTKNCHGPVKHTATDVPEVGEREAT